MTKHICIKLLIVALISGSIASGGVLAKTSLDLAIAGVGARPLGMGKAYVAVADDANALFLNPAGLSLSKEWKATSMSTRMLEMVDYKVVGGVMPTRIGTVGIGYIVLSTPAGYKTTDKNSLSSASEISFGSSELILSLGREIGSVMAGANLKLLNKNFSGYSGAAVGSGYGLDIGVLCKLREDLNLGANLQNAISNVSWGNTSEDLGTVLKIGVAGKPVKDKVLVAVDADLNFSGNGPLALHAGVEMKPIKLLTIRFGADQYPLSSSENATNLTAGAGMDLGNFDFDYAYHQDGNLAGNSTHYFSISIAQNQMAQRGLAEKEEGSTEKQQVLTYYESKGQLLSTTPDDILSYYK